MTQSLETRKVNVIRTEHMVFYPSVEIGVDWINLGVIKIMCDLDYDTFDKEVTEIVKRLIEKHHLEILRAPDEDVYYDYDYHVATIEFEHDDKIIKGDVLVGEANRGIFEDQPYVYEGEEFELYIQLRATTE